MCINFLFMCLTCEFFSCNWARLIVVLCVLTWEPHGAAQILGNSRPLNCSGAELLQLRAEMLNTTVLELFRHHETMQQLKLAVSEGSIWVCYRRSCCDHGLEPDCERPWTFSVALDLFGAHCNDICLVLVQIFSCLEQNGVDLGPPRPDITGSSPLAERLRHSAAAAACSLPIIAKWLYAAPASANISRGTSPKPWIAK